MNPQQPQQFPINEDNRKRSHSSSSSNSPSASPSRNLTEPASSNRKKRNTATNSYSGTDSSSAESSSNPSSSSFGSGSSFFYSSSPSNTTPPRLTAQRSVPAFLNKLYNMVEDISTNNLVRWSKDGTSFLVEKHEEFAKTVLPRFYKHNTFASFVRQLNMYDFHKVPHIQQGVLIAENEHDLWEFSNPHFQRGRPDLLILVTRKRNRDRDTADTENLNVATLVQSIDMLKKHQSTISNDLKDLHRDNEILWQETLSAREKYQNHQEAIEKILQFLTAIFSNENLAITMNNPDLLPKGLIEEAASLAGMPISKLNLKQKSKSSSSMPLNSNLATSALSNIVNSVLKLYSPQSSRLANAPGINQSQLPNHSKQAELQDNKSTNMINDNSAVSLNDFSQTLNTATKSAQSITQDIDTLQLNIETLANELGIDPNQFDDELDLQDNYQQMLKPTSNPNFVELHNDADTIEDFSNYSNKRHLKNMNAKQPHQQVQHKQPRLQRQSRNNNSNNNMYKMNDYRNYLPINNQPDLTFNPAPNAGYYPMGNPMMSNNPAFTPSNNNSNNNNTIVDNPYIVPYYNNNTNEENYDDNT